MPEIMRINIYFNNLALKEKNIVCIRPKRKDGSEHWVSAQTQYNLEVDKRNDISDGLKEFIKHGGGCGYKIRDTGNVQSMQYDMDLFGGWREFENGDLKQMARVHEITVNNETPNEYDKDAIANLAAKRYVRVENGKPVILVPYLRKVTLESDTVARGMVKYLEMLGEYVDINEIVQLIIQNMDYMEQFIPSYLDKNERNSLLSGCATFGENQIMYMLYKNGYLQMPTEDEKKRICTYIWEK